MTDRVYEVKESIKILFGKKKRDVKFLYEAWADGGRVHLSFKSSSQGRNGVSTAHRSGSLFFLSQKDQIKLERVV